MKTSSSVLLLVLLSACGGNSAPVTRTVGPAGGTITSSDGKMSLIIPAGALSSTATLGLARSSDDSGQLLAGSSYRLTAPSVTLSQPAQLRFALGDSPSPSPMGTLWFPRPLVSGPGTVYGSCTSSSAVCYVEAGTGNCPTDHPRATGIELRCDSGSCPTDQEWVLDCAPGFAANPLLVEVGASQNLTILGGTLDGAGNLSASLTTLASTILGAVDDQNAIALSSSAATIAVGESFTLTTLQSSGHGTIGHVDYYDTGFCALDGSGHYTGCMSQQLLLGTASTAPYTLLVQETGLVPGFHIVMASAAYDGASGVDAHGNPLAVDQLLVTISGNPTSPAPTPSPGAFDLYVDPIRGSDSNPGTEAQPFLTLTHMATVAQAGQTIGLGDGAFYEGAMPGTCDGRAVTVPGGLTIRANNPRAAVIGNVSFGPSSGTMTLVDVTMDGGSNGACTGIVGGDGTTLTVSGVSFVHGAHFVLKGSATATLAPGSLTGGSYISSPLGSVFADLSGTASMTINGGILDGSATTAQCGFQLFSLTGSNNLTVNGTKVQNFPGTVIALGGASTAVVNHAVFDHDAYATGCGAVVVVAGGTSFDLEGSNIQNATGGAAIYVSGGGGPGPAIVKLQSSVLDANVRGIFHDDNDGSAPLDLAVSNSSITNSTAEGIYCSSTSALTLVAGITRVSGNAVGISLNVAVGSTINLGGSGGGMNTFANTGPGLILNSAVTANASGDTWLSGQGADTMGHYASATVTGPVTSGVNYQLVTGATLIF